MDSWQENNRRANTLNKCRGIVTIHQLIIRKSSIMYKRLKNTIYMFMCSTQQTKTFYQIMDAYIDRINFLGKHQLNTCCIARTAKHAIFGRTSDIKSLKQSGIILLCNLCYGT